MVSNQPSGMVGTRPAQGTPGICNLYSFLFSHECDSAPNSLCLCLLVLILERGHLMASFQHSGPISCALTSSGPIACCWGLWGQTWVEQARQDKQAHTTAATLWFLLPHPSTTLHPYIHMPTLLVLAPALPPVLHFHAFHGREHPHPHSLKG